MSDISITFPPWFGAWFLLGQAAPITTLGVIGLGAALLFGRGARRVGLLRSLKWALAIVGTAWVAGISYWAFVLADQIATDIYQARHHYRLAKTTVMAGIELPQGSSVFVDEAGRLYEIDTKAGATVSIDGALWQGEIRLIPEAARTASDRGIIKSAILATDAVIQGTPCRAGKLVEFTEYAGGDLLRCTLARRTVVAAEIADADGGMIAEDLACAENRDIGFRIFGHRLLERRVLADRPRSARSPALAARKSSCPAMASTPAHWRRRSEWDLSISRPEPASVSPEGGSAISKCLSPPPRWRCRISFFRQAPPSPSAIDLRK
jgi:hypothetical protein